MKELNCPLEVAVIEDGTKITEFVDYDLESNCLSGLVAPINCTTGIPDKFYFRASKASEIIEPILNYKKAKYVQVILVKPNKIGKKTVKLISKIH